VTMKVSPRNRLVDRESAHSVYLRRPDIVIEPNQNTEITEQQKRHRGFVQLLHHISEAGGWTAEAGVFRTSLPDTLPAVYSAGSGLQVYKGYHT